MHGFRSSTMAMARYHTLPGASLALPNFLTFGSSNRAHELMIELERSELSQYWDLVAGQVVQDQPTPVTQTYYQARQYCNMVDVTRGDPHYWPATSWAVHEDARCGVANKEVMWEPFIFPKSPCKPPVMMIRTTRLTEVRESMLYDRLEVARNNSTVPFNSWEEVVPVVKDFRLINRREGSVALLERPSIQLMDQIHKDLLREDDHQIRRTQDDKILSMGSKPHFFTEQSIFLGLPSYKDYKDIMWGLSDAAGVKLDTLGAYCDCLAWPFLGAVSASAAESFGTFRDYLNADKIHDMMFKTW